MKQEKQGVSKKEEYEEGIKKTLTPLLFGVLAGFLSFLISRENPLESTGFLILFLMIMVQKFVYPLLHTSINSAKDWIYIAFLTFCCWFITFSLLLNVHL
jgi:cell division protein FtsW (lipid II flippase)